MPSKSTKRVSAKRRSSEDSRATGLDRSVSNQVDESARVSAAKKVTAPSYGADRKSITPRQDGTEGVAGFKLLETSPEKLAEMFEVAPGVENLHDIGEASFGIPKTAETVHGPDNRIQITNTGVYPWRASASLVITAADNSSWVGTGWFIGPHTLMTAGHVVYIKNSGVPGRDGWVKSIKVMPGRNGNTLPYGSVTSTNFRSVHGWTDNGDENYDYGAIIIPTELGNTVGWFGFGVYGDADLTASVGNVAGYPADKPSGTLWYDAHRIASVGPRKIYYDIDTFGGQSGSALYRIVNGSRYAMGVHAYGGATTNSATRIVTAVYNNMVSWKN
jgi:V8-like Glu-specific endopeptidase